MDPPLQPGDAILGEGGSLAECFCDACQVLSRELAGREPGDMNFLGRANHILPTSGDLHGACLDFGLCRVQEVHRPDSVAMGRVLTVLAHTLVRRGGPGVFDREEPWQLDPAVDVRAAEGDQLETGVIQAVPSFTYR